ncbi:hypothetical protein KSS87_003356 [Heliosperma pusillum]|nr:hypothetical protein KSS87_003356 [Heliosperma pusillum]
MEALIVRKLGDPTKPPSSDENSAIILSKNTEIPEITTSTSVRIKVAATSLNYANYLQVLGKYQEKATLPFIPGSDYSGIITDVGSAVSKFAVGDRVCSLANLGSFAQYLVADQSHLGLSSGSVFRRGNKEDLLEQL